MLNRIQDLLSDTVMIQIHPDHFYFSTRRVNLQFRTFINIHVVKGKWRVHSVGEELAGSPDVHRIDLFLNSELPPGGNRSEAFEAFLRYAIEKLHRKTRNIIRPLIIVKGAQSLDKILVGYQYNFLKRILGEAGAREVRFE